MTAVSATAASATTAVTATQSAIPAVIVMTATPAATPPPQGSLLDQVWQQNRIAIVTAAISAIIASILVGVFLRGIAESIKSRAAQLFHLLFDRYASTPILRWRYENAYRTALSAFVQKLQSANIVDRTVPLDKVYVPIGLTDEIHDRERGPVADRLTWDDDRRRRQRANSMTIWKALEQKPRMVVLGDPGAGKTTSLYHMAYKCAEKEQFATYTPIFMRLRDLIRVPKLAKLEDALPHEFENRNFPNADLFIQKQIKAGKCLILLDGLDEVDNADQHEEAIALVQSFADRYAIQSDSVSQGSGNRIVVSCRTYSYENGVQLTGFDKTLVMDFEQREIEGFIYNWYSLESNLSELTEELIAALRQNRRFLELARNPLLLLLIADHYERERNLPELRAELYQHCIRTRVTRWNTVRGTHRGRFGESNKLRMLRELALYLFEKESAEEGGSVVRDRRQQGRSAFVSKEDLLEWVEKFADKVRMPEEAKPADLLEEVVTTSGLIVERTIGRFGFSHQTLQEYFAAEAVDRLGPEEGARLLAKYLSDPRWREVILLYCGLADNADPLLRAMIKRATSLADTQEAAAFWIQAGRCLAEGAKASADIRVQVAAELFSLLQSDTRAAVVSDTQQDEAVEILEEFDAEIITNQIAQLPLDDKPSLQLASRFLDKLPDESLKGELLERLTAVVDSGADEEQKWAAAALGHSGEAADASTVASLRRGLEDPSAEVQAQACRSLAQLSATDEATLTALELLYNSDSPDLARHAALEALLTLQQHERVGMVAVPAGEFLMGSSESDKAAEADERPHHKRYLPDYFIDRTPVTNAQFRRFIAANGYAKASYWAEANAAGRWLGGSYIDYDDSKRSQPLYWDNGKWNHEDQPVVGVSWYEALAYARWAGKELPTEAEWEKAARGPDGQIYPWGNDWDGTLANTKESGLKKTTPVDHYSPRGDSPYGAADMAGNVLEWCSSIYQEYPYETNDGREDLAGGDDVGRVLRGGSWATDKDWARCARRYRGDPGDWISRRGFRCRCATSSS